MPEDRQNPGAALRQMLTSFWVPQCLYAAAELGIADAIAGGDQDAGDIARRVGADEGSLYRLLRALASVDVFAESQPRRFVQTPMSELLRRNVPGSLGGLAVYLGRAATRARSPPWRSTRWPWPTC